VTEGLGSAMLEAMAAARAVVGTRAGGIPEAVVHEVTGLLVPTHDDRALAEAIVGLLKDPERRRQFGAAGRRRVIDEFSVERMVQRTIDAYRLVLDRRQA
jgi:glycosyltransferase involved in cell wall biosynthesis